MRRALLVAACAAACVAPPAEAAVHYTDVIVQARTSTAPLAVFPANRQARAGSIETALQYRLSRQPGLLAELRRARAAGQARRVRVLWIAGGYAVSATPREVRRLRLRTDVLAVTTDAIDVRPASVAPNIAALNIPAVWAHAGSGTLAGTTGTGVTVAILDSGVAPFFQLGASYRGGAHDWFDPSGELTAPNDPGGTGSCHGHGTQVASVIFAGDNGATPPVEIGGAPGASWIAARIFDNHCSSPVSNIHAAFQWVLDPDGDPATPDGADVVNNSWDEAGTACDTTFQPDLRALRAAGIVPVFAAGNVTAPAAPGSALAPANLPEALSVGALDTDFATPWSASAEGPSACGSSSPFPTVAAPGVAIPVVANDGSHGTNDGTSLAAPHVTAALALLLARHPGMTAQEQVDALTSTAMDVGPAGVDDQTGAGLVNAQAAFESPSLPAPRDVTAPRVTGLDATPAVANGGSVVLTGHASDAAPGARVTGTVASASATVDAAAPVAMDAVDGAFDGAEEDLTVSLPVTGLADGHHTAVIAALDAAANPGIGENVGFVVDRTPPVVPAPVAIAADGTTRLAVHAADAVTGVDRGEWFSGGDPGQGNGTPLPFAAGSGTGDPAADFALVVDTGGLAPGYHAFTVRVRDGAGNWSATRTTGISVSSRIVSDGFEHGLRRWTSTHGRVTTARAAAILGRRGLSVRLRGARSAYVASTAPGNVSSITAGFDVDLRHAVLPGATAIFDGRARDGSRTLAVQARRPKGFHPTMRLCTTGAAAVCSRWHSLGRSAHAVMLSWSASGAVLTVDGTDIATVAGPLSGRVDSVRLGAVAPSRGSRGEIHVDDVSIAR